MRIRVLGCSGGIGGGRHTTSFLVDEDILIDAGSGVTHLDLASMQAIDHVFITHTHLDHILALPPLMDSVASERAVPLSVYAIPEVLAILREHVFNWRVWPDFSVIPSAEAPFMRYVPIEVGQPVMLGNRVITAIPARHTVPAVGYRIQGTQGSLIFSGDTASHRALWDAANATPDLRHLIVETSFGNEMREIAEVSGHYCPETLLADLAGLKAGAEVWITHLKPGGEAQIMDELRAGGQEVQALIQGQCFEGL